MSKKVLFKGKKVESLQYLISKWNQKCPQCAKLFSSKFCLARHLRIHKEEGKAKKFECIICKKRFQEIANYLRHCMFHDRSKNVSKGFENGCDSRTEGHSNFNTSFGDHIGATGLVSLQSNSNLNAIKYDYYVPDNGNETEENDSVDGNLSSGGKFSCGHCPKSYDKSSSLSRHVARVHKQGYKCRVCGHVLSTIDNYLQHTQKHEKKHHKCQFCSRTFNNKKSCTIHERVHTGEKPYQCDTCQRSFTQKSHLSDHMRTHSGARPFACNQCSLAFTTHSSRRRHQRVVHQIGEKEAFPCDICGAVLSTKYSINLHQKKHENGMKQTKEKKFLCSICDGYFASSSSLRKHLKRMHNNMGGNTLCKICNLTYYSEATLRQHLSRAHGITESNETVESISCDECGALMQTKSGILIHKRRCHEKSS